MRSENTPVIKYLYNIAINGKELELWSHKSKSETFKPSETYSHMHYYAEFQYIYSGSITIICGKQKIEASSGDLCLIPSGAYHGLINSQTVKRECFFVRSDADKKLSDILAGIKEAVTVNDSYIKSAMDCFATSENSELRGFLLASAAMRVITLCSDESTQIFRSQGLTGDISSERERIVEEFMSAGHGVGDLSELADKLCLSKRQTRNVVNSVLGTDFNTASTKQKISNAVHIIKTTNLPLSEIAALVGYGSYSGFYMAFVRITGKKPQDMRK